MEPQGWAGLVAARDPKDAVSRWPLGAAAHRPAQRGQLLAAGLWAPGAAFTRREIPSERGFEGVFFAI